MVSVYDIFGKDEEYQNKLNEFNRKKARFEEMARQGIYNKEHLMQVSKQLSNDLSNFLREHKEKRKNERVERMEELKNTQQKIGYTERKDEAKEFEMRFALANDFELKRMVDELKTDDLLELNLLRTELKKRGFDQTDKSNNNYDMKVKNYINQNNLNGMTHEQQKEYDQLQEEFKIYNSLGAGFIVGEDSFTPFNNIEQELNKTVSQINAHSRIQRNVRIEEFSL